MRLFLLVFFLPFTALGAGEEVYKVPLSQRGNWQVLQYSRIPPHKVAFSAAGLELGVEASAMPLILPLERTFPVRAVRVKGRILEGSVRVPAGRQGQKEFDDYAFRIGLVEPGERRLGVVERQFAASWVRRLFELAPAGGGISRIHFLNLGADKVQVGQRRVHPLSDLLDETVVAVPGEDGRFDFTHALERPLQTIALWLSSDGDDTQSRYRLLVEAIELHR